MAYSDFTLSQIQKAFGVSIHQRSALFSAVPAVAISDYLDTTLKHNVPLALAINTEKARSELIIAPILVEAQKISPQPLSLFSGIEFNVDPKQGLSGTCDFILSRSDKQLYLNAPAAVIVEAKNENITRGLGQCIATMIAARIFNEQEGNNLPVISGSVTTGDHWKFLKLEGNAVSIDLDDYYIPDVDKILGVLLGMVEA
jgi:hypothetical protein